jgi:large subunit ribosomal protein L24
MHIRKGDQVAVISGKDRGKKGKVLRVNQGDQRAIVEGVNMLKKHVRADPRKGVKGGVLEREAPIHVSNLLPIDPESGKPTRVGHKFLEGQDGKRRKIRVALRSGAELDR